MNKPTPYAQGRAAGYRDEPLSANPYIKGLVADAALPWAMEWIRGYIEGAKQAHDDLIARRLEACR